MLMERRGGQRKRWEHNIKEWTGMDFASSARAAEDRTRLNVNDLARLWKHYILV